MSYVDGFVIPVARNKVAAYKKLAVWGKKMWMKHGAIQYFECAGDDLVVPPDCGKDFQTLLSLKPTETVFFSFIVYKNKAHRNAVNKKVMAGMTKESMPKAMPFDVNRMTHGGFKTVVQG